MGIGLSIGMVEKGLIFTEERRDRLCQKPSMKFGFVSIGLALRREDFWPIGPKNSFLETD